MDVDVVVVGGGPAGSATATFLARQGWRVRLYERANFPREHVGESLLPASLPILADLGVLPAVESAGFTPKAGATMVWGSGQEPWSWYFSETNQRYPHAYQVWRPTFDKLLLDNARARGVDVREGHRVTAIDLEHEDGCLVTVAPDGEPPREVTARFVVDASGQTGLIGRMLRLRVADSFFRNLAVYGYYEGAERLPAPDSGNIFIESFDGGWLWAIPLSNGWMSVGCVVDSEAGQAGIRDRGSRGFLDDQVSRAPHMSRMLRTATFTSGPEVVRDWSYLSEEVAGERFVLVGDAACFVDPLFSSGVHLALSSSVLASAYVTSALRDPDIAPQAAQVYKQLYYQQYSHFRELAQLFYSSNRSAESYFWEARRLLDEGGDMSPRQAFIAAVAGQPPMGYERAVLDRGDVPPEILEQIATVEDERERRQQRIDNALEHDVAALMQSVPMLANEAHVERKPVLGDGVFEWGYSLVTPERRDGTPVSALVARMVGLVDGQRPLAAVLQELTAGLDDAQAQRAVPIALAALQILHTDGAIAELRGLEEPG